VISAKQFPLSMPICTYILMPMLEALD
jgi:hypothetical protein